MMIWPLCVVDIEVFTDEEAKGAQGAKDEQQEGREELRFVVNLYKYKCKYKYQEGKEELKEKITFDNSDKLQLPIRSTVDNY